MKRRIRYMALLLVLCMLALTGCAQPRDTMTLRVCLDAAPATLDPAMASSDAERTVVAHLFENLMKLSRGEDGGIQPTYAAAKSYTVEDNLDGTETYTFTLRQNVRWSDGQTVTAHDFVYAWQRLADPATGSPHAALLDMVAGYSQAREKQDGSLLQVSAPDDFTFVVQLSYKCAYFLTDVCAASATMPVRSDAAEQKDWSLHSETLLTDGPYRATAWEETGLTALAADGYYDARRLGPDVLEFRFETDGQKRAELVEHGDVDFAMNLPEGDTSDPYPQTTVLLLNQRAESLENESLRRALSLVIDRSALVEGLSCDAAEGIVPPGLRNTMGGDFRTESGSLVDNAPDNYEALCQQAKTLLEEAGGVKAVGQITLLYDTSDETATNTAMAVRDAWKHQLGIIAVMRRATAQELAEAVNRGEYIVALTTLTADRGDASGLLSWWQSGSSFHSTAYVMLLRAAEASGRVEVRDAYLEDAERMLVEDGWVIPLYYPHRHSGLGQHLTAPLYDGTGVYLFSGVVQQTPQ